MATKLTLEQQQKAWLALQSKVKPLKYKKEKKEAFNFEKMTQAQKDKALLKAIAYHEESNFAKLVESGARCTLEVVSGQGTVSMLEIAIKNGFEVKNQTKLWQDLHRSDNKRTELLLKNKIPYGDQVILDVWNGKFSTTMDFEESVYFWLKNGGRVVPFLIPKANEKKKLENQLEGFLSYLICYLGPEEFHSFLSQLKNQSEKTNYKPISSISMTPPSTGVWNKILRTGSTEDKFLKGALEFGLFPEMKTPLNITPANFKPHHPIENLPLGWLTKAFMQGVRSFFDVLAVDPTQKEIFIEDLKTHGALLIFQAKDPVLDSPTCEVLLDLGFDFKEKDSSKNSVFHFLFKSAERERYCKKQPCFTLSPKVWGCIIENAEFVLNSKNTNRKNALDVLSANITFKTPYGVFNKQDLEFLLEKSVLEKKLGAKPGIQVTKIRL